MSKILQSYERKDAMTQSDAKNLISSANLKIDH